MFSILPIAVVSGALVAGAQLPKRPKATLMMTLTAPRRLSNAQGAPANPSVNAITTLRGLTTTLTTYSQALLDALGGPNTLATVRKNLAQLDEAAARITQTRLERWLYQARQAQLAALIPANAAPVAPLQAREIYRELNLAALGLGLMVGGFVLHPWLLVPAVALDVYLLRHAYLGLPRALWVERRINASVLFVILDAVALTAGLFVTHAYLLLYAIIAMLVMTTRIFKLATEDHARHNLMTLFGLRQQTVWLLHAGIEIEVPLTQVQAGDLVAVHAGAAIPVDGTIREGMALIDQHLLTGEAQPVEKGPGDAVFATTVVLRGKLVITVAQAGEQTVAAQIVHILDQTTDYRTTLVSWTQTVADQIALPFLCLGALAFPLVGVPGLLAVLNSGTALFYMNLLGHLGVLNFLNRAAQQGLLVKDGRALEQLTAVDTVVFDKTGTLTLAQPTVVAIHRCTNAYDEATILTYAAAAEHRQNHPIAQAILQAAATRNLPLPTSDQASYHMGYGIAISLDGAKVRVGSARFMAQHDIPLPATIAAVLTQTDQLGHSLVLVAVEQQLVGALELQPTLRPEVKVVIAALRQRGIKTCHIISGDQEAPTRALAAALGMDSYSAQTLPDQKAAIIQQMQAAGQVVCYIGDGINDAIALKAAAVSVSLRGASSVAVDAAQVVLMSQTLHQLTALFALADDFDRYMKTCFTISLAPGLATIYGAFFLHFGLATSVALNQVGLWTGVAHSLSPLQHLRQRAEERRQAN